MLKTDVDWAESMEYASDSSHEPIEFFSETLCNATSFDLMLGFFSSSAINVLADGFAAFLYNGGKMRMIINDILSDDDKLAIGVGESDTELFYFDLSSLQNIRNILSKRDRHFFECLAWLIRNNKIEIKIVAPKDGKGIAHSKFGVFRDYYNKVGFNGSCNFTKTALVDNIEHISVFSDWNNETDKRRIERLECLFDETFNGNNLQVEYKDAASVRTAIAGSFAEKDIKQLISEESELLNEHINGEIRSSIKATLKKIKQRLDELVAKEQNIKEEDEKPHFPYKDGPRDYQKRAFDNWKANKQKGFFAMATGTGKTITSLNCLYEIYKHCGYYKALILVPSILLVEQWEDECAKFAFKHVVKVCSKNSRWQEEITQLRMLEEFGNVNSYIIIATYSSFARDNVFTLLNSFPRKQLLFIADEAHNMGSKSMLERLPSIKYLRRIGLSATPERQYDIESTMAIKKFFGIDKEYTFSYPLDEAIHNGFLCKYLYYPHVVELAHDEMKEYIALSAKIAKYYSVDDNALRKGDPILTALLLKRKRIIHKAENKKIVFKDILERYFKEKHSLKYTLVYVPEGNTPDYGDNSDCVDDVISDDFTDSLIDEYSSIVKDIDDRVTVRKFTAQSKDRNEILNGFANGDIDVLTSMKCLDEGVDVPRSELAIFCASTGNPRQFIQRRGRILRKHKDKKIAIIHDLVVAPKVDPNTDSFSLERSLLASELRRVRSFALSSENSVDSLDELDDVMNYYALSIFN